MRISVEFAVTFCTFLAEALFHYNLGKHGTLSLAALTLPSGGELFDIVKVLVVFSAINAYLIPMVQTWSGSG